jgi:hypothetical protein
MTLNDLIITQQDLYMFAVTRNWYVMLHTHNNRTPGCLCVFSSGRRCRDADLRKFVRPFTRRSHSSHFCIQRPTGSLPQCMEFRDVFWRHWLRHWNLLGRWGCDGLCAVFMYLFIHNAWVSNQENEGVYLQRFCVFTSDIYATSKESSLLSFSKILAVYGTRNFITVSTGYEV